MLDLKQVALDVKDEQLQSNTLLQAIHSFVDKLQPVLQQQAQQIGGGMFGTFFGDGFGRAMEIGAGVSASARSDQQHLLIVCGRCRTVVVGQS
ncbi:MAG: hypothetical protein ACR2QA_19365 [Solirubrobacteraceae bacterium]